MPDIIDFNGLQTKSLTELREEQIEALKEIYGDDINVEQNSPDGQQVNIYSQGGVDIREVLQQLNANFDPDQAQGRLLDQRVAINGITRNGGTYTQTPIDITTDRALNLVGLDDQSDELNPTVQNLYTVKDDAGTQFYLLSSVSIGAAGTNSLTFRAADIGQVEVQVNTITTPVTVVAGVTDINNPSGATVTGQDEETDAQLKVRRKTSVALPSIGYLDGIESTIANLDGVTVARVYENDTNSTDGDGTPAYHIWAIVEGGNDTEIGEVLYRKKSAGAGMRGAEVVEIDRPNGSTYETRFDRPGTEDLYIRFSIQVIGGGFIDENNLKEQIASNISWEIGGEAGADDVVDFVKNLNSKYRVTGMQLSKDDITYTEVVSVASPQNRFVNDVSRITII